MRSSRSCRGALGRAAPQRPPYTSDPTENQIVDAYSKITGYKEGDTTTDKGADLLSVLKYWQSTGIADQRIRAFAEVPSRDINTLKWSIASFGVAYVGLLLPSAWGSPIAVIRLPHGGPVTSDLACEVAPPVTATPAIQGNSVSHASLQRCS